MAAKVLVLVGTRKGAFIVESGAGRRSWRVRGPFCETWPINHMVADPAEASIYGAGGSEWLGAAVWKSTDLGASWTHSSQGLAYGEGEDPVKSVWSLAPDRGGLYAGVEPAGLFRSDDAGATWRHLPGLRDHPSRPDWQPGGGGLILHSMVLDPTDPASMWVGISTAGVFHTADGGASWEPRNRGTRADYMPEDQRYPEVGQCVHCVVGAPGMAQRLYQQNHCGMYRSEDGGRSWASIEAGLPSSFGFPVAAHPRDPETVYLVPLNGDVLGRYPPQGKCTVWRSRDRGDTWQALRKGMPKGASYFGVLRQAMAVDRLDPAGVYFGTSNGGVFASADEGDSWRCIAEHLPTVLSVETLVVDG
jgi:photosystem II stability/assembly factor-like uncharacterized protein